MQKNLYALCLAFILIGVHHSLLAQKEDITGSMPFFQQRAQSYQNWLEAKGLNQVLHVDKVRFKRKDKNELEMLFVLESTNLDSALGLWFTAKRGYDTPGDSLEHYLFRNFIHTMEIPDAQGNIQIYVKDERQQYIPCFHVFAWSESGLIKTLTKIDTCKGAGKELRVEVPAMQTIKKVKGKKTTITRTHTSEVVFNTILDYINTKLIEHPRYKTDELNDRTPSIEPGIERTATTLKFTVAGLGKEVLTNQNRSEWQKWVGINTIAMERLTFQFEYRARSASEGGGFVLIGNINGKFGSGIFKPRTSGYIDMQPDFDDYLESYKNNLQEAIEKQLKKQ
jgi:hypothetical protein